LLVPSIAWSAGDLPNGQLLLSRDAFFRDLELAASPGYPLFLLVFFVLGPSSRSGPSWTGWRCASGGRGTESPPARPSARRGRAGVDGGVGGLASACHDGAGTRHLRRRLSCGQPTSLACCRCVH